MTTKTTISPDVFTTLMHLLKNSQALAQATQATFGHDKEPLVIFKEDAPGDFFLKEEKNLLSILPKDGIIGKSLQSEIILLCSLLKDIKENRREARVLQYSSDYLVVNIRLNQHASTLRTLSERMLQLQ